MRRKTKIVATLGPAIKDYEMLRDFLALGVDVVRLNFSHGSHETHKTTVQWLRKASIELKKEVALLADLQGPKIRTGSIPVTLLLSKGQEVFFCGSSDRLFEGNGTKEKPIGITYPRLASEIKKGDSLLIEDGLTCLRVEQVDISKNLLTTRVVHGESLSSHKGVNLPTAKLSTSAITEKDWGDILFGIEHGVDFFALSFVRTAQEVKNLKQFLLSKNSSIQVIAKIEKQEALENLKEILEASDGIMIARGDLGVEIGNERVPIVQKMITQMCRSVAKPVITATQMLMSMVHQPTPSRAEASDIANAVFEGSDALMLSNETASGAFPLRAVETMERIIVSAESDELKLENRNIQMLVEKKAPLEAAASMLAHKMNASALMCLTRSGLTARNLSSLQPLVPIYAFVESDKVRRQLALSRGVFVVPWKEVKSQDYTVFDEMSAELYRLSLLKKNDLVVSIAGIPTSLTQGTSNTVALRRVGASSV
jgi:pyruvate kinase